MMQLSEKGGGGKLFVHTSGNGFKHGDGRRGGERRGGEGPPVWKSFGGAE